MNDALTDELQTLATTARQRLVEGTAQIGRRRARFGNGRRRLTRNDLEARLLACDGPRRLAPLGEDVLERIVLPDDAGQFRKRIGLLPRAGRLPRSAELALKIFEIERETIPSWLTHGTIHSSTSRFLLWKNRELCAVNLTLCAPPEKPFPSAHLFRRRNSGDSQTGSKDAAHRVHERQSRQGRLSISLINEP